MADENIIYREDGTKTDENGVLVNDRIVCRHRDEIIEVDRERVDYIDISPRMMVSVAMEAM